MPKTETTETPTTVETAENIRVEACTRTLKVVLSDREVLDRSADLTNTMDELANIEQEFASAKEQFKARVSEATAKVQRLKCEVRDRFVHVPVACDRIFNYAAGQVRIRRKQPEAKQPAEWPFDQLSQEWGDMVQQRVEVLEQKARA